MLFVMTMRNSVLVLASMVFACNAQRIQEDASSESLATLLFALSPAAIGHHAWRSRATLAPVMQKDQPVTWDGYLSGGFAKNENAQLAGMMDEFEAGNMDRPKPVSTTEGDLPTWGDFASHEKEIESLHLGGGYTWAAAGLSTMPKDFQSQLGYPAAGTPVTPEQQEVLKKIGVFDALVAKGGLTKR
jgi:hypothetical protein